MAGSTVPPAMRSWKVLPFFLFINFLNLSHGCNKRTIVLRGPKLTREYCQGCKKDQADESGEASKPPGASTIDGSTPPTAPPIVFSIPSNITDGTASPKLERQLDTDLPTTPGKDANGPIIPVGDCKCGLDISWDMIQPDNSTTRQLNRPWMVHFKIQLENKGYIECSGSLVNRKWIISAAHCFCALNEVHSIEY